MTATHTRGQRSPRRDRAGGSRRLPVLRDRVRERAQISAALDAARSGGSAVLVVRGPAGIGKSMLLDHAAGGAAGMWVGAVVGVEAEQEWGYATLHHLLRPHLHRRGALPAAQRSALGAAFGLHQGPPPDRYLVGLAALTLLADAANEQPLLCVVDDAQWVDGESRDVLTFVGRRLDHDGIALLFGLRDSSRDMSAFAALPQLTVPPLPAEDATALLADALDTARLDQVVADHILVEAGGNPLALTEFALAARRDEPTPEGPLPLDRKLESAFVAQAGEVSVLTRTLLLIVAADGDGRLDLVERAFGVLGHRPRAWSSALDEAQAAHLLVVDRRAGHVAFRHPLIRSAVYGSAGPELRRPVHAALAEALGTDADPERRAWHLAAAAAGPDDGLAALLDAAAARARDRGGHLAQSALLSRAAELTLPGLLRNRRLRAACAAALGAGAPRRAEGLLGRCTPLDPPENPAADLRFRGLLSLALGRPDSVALLLRAARAETDLAAARRMLLEALNAAVGASALVGGDALRHVAQDTLARRAPTGSPATVADLLLDGHATLVDTGPAAAAPILTAAIRAGLAQLRHPAAEDSSPARTVLLGMFAAMDLWDIEAFSDYAGGHAAAAAAQGRLQVLHPALYGLALCNVYTGRFATAAMYIDEAEQTVRVLGTDGSAVRAGSALLHAWTGDDATVTDIVTTLTANSPTPVGHHIQYARCAAVLRDLARGRYEQARAGAAAVLAEDPAHCGALVLPDLIEAASRAGAIDDARHALVLLTERVAAAGTPWAQALLTRSRALVASDDLAEPLHLEAIARFARTPVRTDHARAHLLYGEWLRRRRRRADARTALRTAHSMFLDMGATAFAERAGVELAATGERARARAVDTARTLTPQEYRIAHLAATGAGNQEIATSLFISTNTVEHHLRNVYRKLDVGSRRRLEAVLQRMDVPGAPRRTGRRG